MNPFINTVNLSQVSDVVNWLGSLDIDTMVSDDCTAVNILDRILPVFKSLGSDTKTVNRLLNMALHSGKP